eukprot:GHVR01008433.1.p2 GENE.GHVR01008433.1~~GHVR01008433.1.p2  ORF type:complete len:167 (+),score=69.71 GHVR01008433.1:555-1055(+)
MKKNKNISELETYINNIKENGGIIREAVEVEVESGPLTSHLIESINEREDIIADLHKHLHKARNEPPRVIYQPQEIFLEVPKFIPSPPDIETINRIQKLQLFVQEELREVHEGNHHLLRAGVQIQVIREREESLKYIEKELSQIMMLPVQTNTHTHTHTHTETHTT